MLILPQGLWLWRLSQTLLLGPPGHPFNWAVWEGSAGLMLAIFPYALPLKGALGISSGDTTTKAPMLDRGPMLGAPT